MLKRYFVFIFGIISISLGISLTIKAAIGVGAWGAISQSTSLLTNIKVGTVTFILSSTCVLLQLIILHKNFNYSRFLQILVSISFGIFTNFFYYELLGKILLNSYWMQVLVFVIGVTIIALAIAIVMIINIVTIPLEALVMVISQKIRWDFSKLRQVVDILFIIYSLIITFVFNQPLIIREGTIISMLIFGPLLGLFINKLTPMFERHQLTK